MDTAKALFVEQLVAALRENAAPSNNAITLPSSPPSPSAASDAGHSSENAAEDEKSTQEYTGLFLSGAAATDRHSREQLAREAYAQLQYDYPEVLDASIEALAELYRRIPAEDSSLEVATEVPITATLVDGVAFLNSYHGPSSMGSSSRRPIAPGSEVSGLLAASLLLRVFRMCLETPDDARVNALLSLLVLPDQSESIEQRDVSDAGGMKLEGVKEEEYVEKYAAQEDPDDLSEVYEGHLPDAVRAQSTHYMIDRHTAAKSAVSRTGQLQYLASRTFSSSFESVSMEKWEQWRLDDDLVAIMKLLIDHPETEGNQHDAASVALYGVRGEWSRYLYVLRDRVLRFPGSSRDALWQLQKLVVFFHGRQSAVTAANTVQQCAQPPQYVVYCVLAELAMSPEFHQGTVQRAQQSLASIVQELIPFIAEEIHQLAAAPNALTRPTKIAESGQNSENVADDDGGGDMLVAVVLQLLHFMLFASSNAKRTTETLHESGVLRTLLMLLPPASDSRERQQSRFQDKRWFPALLRFFGECALWHAGFATYVARVPKFTAILPMMREQCVVEELLFALAIYHHEVQIRTTSADWTLDVWKTFTSESLFPLQCESYVDAMKKLQDAVFLLACLEKVLVSLRRAMQKELQCSLQQIYSAFRRSFEYPEYVVADAARLQQFDPQENGGTSQDIDAAEKKKDRGQVEVLQFTALRNKLRQSVKSLLAALSLGSAMTSTGGRVSSKLD
ncbi:unnamed protein product [Hyaloperonospora brassicae]|uniref:Uncharacterized protein n=1 Tax=Hyaloperonospora brassicae TaxID=162125 RepID=A0AAV0U832_HYABA|nr:unnamed protein product [Hyaloperonospora brassicae]